MSIHSFIGTNRYNLRAVRNLSSFLSFSSRTAEMARDKLVTSVLNVDVNTSLNLHVLA